MTDREKFARQWAENAMQKEVRAGDYGDKFLDEQERADADYILEHTAPPTMVDVEWDDEKHYLGGATIDGDPCVMVKEGTGGEIWIIDLELKGLYTTQACDLVPNGKRYELREKPDHPEVLRTVEDYQNAPVWTVVSDIEAYPYCKGSDHRWHVANSTAHFSSAHLAEGIYMNVLRWGGEA